MKEALRVLVVEDSESDTELIIRQLKKAEYSVYHERVETVKEMKAALEKQTWDIIISDYKLPRFSAPAALELLQKTKLDIPFIVISGVIGEEKAVDLMKAGAHDYLMKNKLARLAPVVKREIAEAQIRRERKQTFEKIYLSERRFRTVMENAPVGIYLIGIDGRFLSINIAMCEMLGYSNDELLGLTFNDITSNEDKEIGSSLMCRALSGEISTYSFEKRCLHKNGHKVWVSVSSSLMRDNKNNPMYFISHIQDITERKLAEEALKHSEEMFRGVITTVPVGIGIASDREVQWVNDNLLQLIGRQKEEVVKNSTRIFYSSDEMYNQVGNQFYKDLREKGIAKMDVDWKHKNGRILKIILNGVAVDQQDLSRGIVFAALDITERKYAEEELIESEERYRRLVEFSPDAIAVHSEGKIVYVNPAAITLLGANNTSDLLGKPFLDIIHPDYRDYIHQQIIAVMKENYAIPLTEQKFLRLDGSIVEVEVAALPIVFRKKPAMQIVVRDISEQRKLQRQLLQTQKIQSIGTLAGGIAHDFNNILGIILAYSSLIEKGKLPPEKFSSSITAINQAVQRGAALVRQILTFARQTDTIFEPMDVSDLIHEILSMLEQTFPKTITLSENIASSLPLIFADRTQVHQALLNLCINSRDAMPQGGLITIAAEKKTKEHMIERFPAASEEEYLCLIVSDTGKGMDEATCLRVFDPFFTTKEKGKGTGLGLSVVYGIVQAHHGFIDFKSKVGFGTTFQLFFPVAIVKEQAIDIKQLTQSFEIGGTETILFVEDEDLLIQMVSFLLESKGYTVLCAHNGLEAVNLFQSHNKEIALVITDMGLPVMTGMDEFKKIKEIDPSVKVIFASGYFEPNIRSELLKDGAKGFIQKPYDPDDILRLIRQVLDQKV